ncbi:MAG: hypothetical protein GC134_00645 [Proteobacteria bacterium]|nr:hypothetical protein [Pseudomonadota bacterium]
MSKSNRLPKEVPVKMRKHVYLVALMPGGHEAPPVEVKSRRLKGVKLPSGAYGFYFYDQYQGTLPDGDKVFGPVVNRSPTHIVGELINRDNIQDKISEDLRTSIVRDMVHYGAENVVLLRAGYTMHRGERVISPNAIGGYAA